MTDSLAQEVFNAGEERRDEAIAEVMSIKAEAKGKFQLKFGLTVDPDAQLVCVLGRMTHQKVGFPYSCYRNRTTVFLHWANVNEA